MSTDSDDTAPEFDPNSGDEAPEDPLDEPIILHKKKRVYKVLDRRGVGINKPGKT